MHTRLYPAAPLLLLACLLAAPLAVAQANQPTRRVISRSTLPSTCLSSVLIKDVIYKTGSSAGLYICTSANTWTGPVGAASGDVVGPASATADAIAIYDGTTGKLLKNSAVTIDATGNVAMAQDKTITISGSGSGDLIQTGHGSSGPRWKNVDGGNAWALLSLASVTADRTYTLPNADGTFTLGGNTFTGTGNMVRQTAPTLTGVTINSAVSDGTGLQHVRVASCTTGSLALDACDATVTWPVAFADTNYTAIATLDSPSGGLVFILSTKNKTTTTIDVTLVTLTAAASSGTINLVGMHD